MKANTALKTNAASGKLATRSKQKAPVIPTGFQVLTGAEEIKKAGGTLKQLLAANAKEHKVSVTSLGKTCLVH